MNVTLDEAIEIYARASHRWFGSMAPAKTQARIEQLSQAGDAEGAIVHERVKTHIVTLQQGKPTLVRSGRR
jgi:hypothetical protein